MQIALPVPLRKTFDYLANENENLAIGMRVIVPFGKSTKVGVVTDLKQESDYEISKLKPINSVLDEQPVLSNTLFEVVHWAANYYQHPIGDAIFSALPKLLREGKSLDDLKEFELQKTDKLPNIDDISTRAKQQKALIEHLNQAAVAKSELKDLNITSTTINKFIDSEWAQWQEIEYQQKDFLPEQVNPHLDLNTEQSLALSAINNSSNGCFLIDGVTGSGKTEIYLQAIENILLKQKQVLVLVPEIGLTPQTLARFEQRFNTPIGVWHSGMTDKQRLLTWHGCLNGKFKIVIATRSGIFLPFDNLGMIIIDEEHDASFKQQEGFKYHCRSIALYRAHKLHIPTVLGSATPSFESLNNAKSGKFHYLQLRERATGNAVPKIKLIDLNIVKQQNNLAENLVERMRSVLANGQQVMLFINRRGFAPVLMCEECHWVTNCHRCSSFATYHKSKQALICHHCGHQQPVYHQCQDCGSTRILPIGTGTEQVEQTIESLFPDFPVVRLDRDKTANKGKFEEALELINTDEPTIIIGTQMIAKGHHFNNVALVGVLDVDGALFSTDFRSSEKLAQLMVQVSGRAGRSHTKGEVYLQTRFPEHPIIQDLINNSYADIASYALSEREALCLPPYSHIVIIRAESLNEYEGANWLSSIVPVLQQYKELLVLGPSPAPLSKKAGKYRHILTLQCRSRSYLHNIVDWLIQNLDSYQKNNKLRWSIDVDPVDLS